MTIENISNYLKKIDRKFCCIDTTDSKNLFIHNQYVSPQPTSNFWISGNGRIDGILNVSATGKVAIGADYSTLSSGIINRANFNTQITGQVLVEGTNTQQVVFVGPNVFNPGFVYNGANARTSMYTFSSMNLYTETDGSTRINTNRLVFQNTGYIEGFQQALTIKRLYPGSLGNNSPSYSTLILNNDLSGTPPLIAQSHYRILSMQWNGTEVALVRGNGDFDTQGYIMTGNPTAGTRQPIKLGSVVNLAVTLDTTKYWEVDVNGAAYKVALVN